MNQHARYSLRWWSFSSNNSQRIGTRRRCPSMYTDEINVRLFLGCFQSSWTRTTSSAFSNAKRLPVSPHRDSAQIPDSSTHRPLAQKRDKWIKKKQHIVKTWTTRTSDQTVKHHTDCITIHVTIIVERLFTFLKGKSKKQARWKNKTTKQKRLRKEQFENAVLYKLDDCFTSGNFRDDGKTLYTSFYGYVIENFYFVLRVLKF